MKFKLESGIPLPTKRVQVKAGFRKYPFRDMTVGQSFLVKATPSTQSKVSERLRSSAGQPALKPARFSVRQVENGVRVWRVS